MQDLILNDEESFEDRLFSIICAQREKTAEVGRNAMSVMISKGIVNNLKNVVAKPGNNSEDFSVSFNAFLDDEELNHKVVENFKTTALGMEFLRIIIDSSDNKKLKDKLISKLDNWNGFDSFEIESL